MGREGKKCFAEIDMKIRNRNEFEQANMFGTGIANEVFARYFIGESFLNPLTDPKECPLFGIRRKEKRR